MTTAAALQHCPAGIGRRQRQPLHKMQPLAACMWWRWYTWCA